MNMNMLDYIRSIENEMIDSVTTSVLRQLNNLVSSGVLIIHKNSGSLVHDSITDSIKYYPEITLELKDKDYIEKLELDNSRLIGENKRLMDMIRSMSEVAANKRWE